MDCVKIHLQNVIIRIEAKMIALYLELVSKELNHLAAILHVYSRLRNKHRGTLINFWTFFQGLRSLLERVMHIFFQNIHYFTVWGCLF